MADVSRQQKLQLGIFEALFQNAAEGQVLVGSDAVSGRVTKIVHQSDQVSFAYQREKFIQVVCFFGKFLLEPAYVIVKAGRDSEPGSVGKVKAIHWVHLDPFRSDPQRSQQRAGNGS